MPSSPFTEYLLPYGRTQVALYLPADREVTVIAPRPVAAADDPAGVVAAALAQPVGAVTLDSFKNAARVAIAISDKTRPLPPAALLPLLAHLESLGVPADAITLLVATGTHIPMSGDEIAALVPPGIAARYRILSHDCDDAANLVHKGETAFGTPVSVNRHWDAADLRIVTGNLNPHQFMGYSGGVKGAAIGLTARETINTNHARMVEPGAKLGAVETNPVRQDVEEIGRLIGVHFALNLILNNDKQIVHALAGEPRAVMAAGVPLARALFEIGIDEPFDVVFTSPGGHPKDINLYQAQKALAHAALITKDGGSVVLVAACPEGTGSRGYEAWIAGMSSHKTVLDRFRREPFQLGPHKAFQIARDAVRIRPVIVSDMPADFVRGLMLTPARSPDDAVALTVASLPPGARIGILPAANATVPVLAAPVAR